MINHTNVIDTKATAYFLKTSVHLLVNGILYYYNANTIPTNP